MVISSRIQIIINSRIIISLIVRESCEDGERERGVRVIAEKEEMVERGGEGD